MAFSDDGRHLVIVLDETGRPWDVESGQPFDVPFPNEPGFLSATLAGPAPSLATAVGDKVLV